MKNLKLKTNKRPFVILYNDFIKCNLLNWNEKDIYPKIPKKLYTGHGVTWYNSIIFC